jgi:UDP-glucose 4-epimerase
MILITGAAGYIGSHAWVNLISNGYSVIGIDNFSNSNPGVIDRIEKISGVKPIFLNADVTKKSDIEKIFEKYPIKAVMHFAAYKSVHDSVLRPIDYYQNNLIGLLVLCEVMIKYACSNFIFSSSATVYGNPSVVPVDESAPLFGLNPYAQTKIMGEQVLRDIQLSNSTWRVAYLRYFNPVGAHQSGLIGENPLGAPNNLMPYISQVASGLRSKLIIYGDDWSTHDGTGVRDYIHVLDLVEAHRCALNHLLTKGESLTVNLGTGTGYSVLDVVRAYESVAKLKINYEFGPRRLGDVAISYANSALAYELIGWRAKHDLLTMCKDSWRWQLNNPRGYS